MKGETMNTTKTTEAMRRPVSLGLLAPLVLIGLAAAPHARANILLAQTTLVNGTESTVDSFTTPGAGSVTVSLQSLNWPTALGALSFSATSANQVLASWSGTGAITGEVTTFDVAAGGTYFAHIMAAASGTLDLGLYSLEMSFTPTSSVPLLPSDWMLLTGVFALAGIARVVRSFEWKGAADEWQGTTETA
jgi:hypothetical protein